LFTVDNDYHGAADARFFSFFLSIADNWKSASNREKEKKKMEKCHPPKKSEYIYITTLIGSNSHPAQRHKHKMCVCV
jgi:hypothetical protein